MCCWLTVCGASLVCLVVRSKGLYPSDAPDEAFSFSDVYNPVSFETARG